MLLLGGESWKLGLVEVEVTAEEEDDVDAADDVVDNDVAVKLEETVVTLGVLTDNVWGLNNTAAATTIIIITTTIIIITTTIPTVEALLIPFLWKVCTYTQK
jgi:hypothetical protein